MLDETAINGESRVTSWGLAVMARLEKIRFAMKIILTLNLGPILPPSFGSQSMGRVSMEAFLVISV